VKRSLAVLATPLVALAVLGVAACGDDDDDAPETSPSVDGTVEDGEDTQPDDGTVPETLPGGGSLPDLSIPDLSIPDLSLPGGTLPGGITIPDLSIPDLSLPDISVPDMTEILGQIFPNLSEDQISCLADALGDVGTDIDPNQVIELFGDCDIDPGDILGGG
jgi:hypothetical protein